MRWWLVIIQVIVLSAVKDMREQFVPTWHRTGWINAQNRYVRAEEGDAKSPDTLDKAANDSDSKPDPNTDINTDTGDDDGGEARSSDEASSAGDDASSAADDSSTRSDESDESDESEAGDPDAGAKSEADDDSPAPIDPLTLDREIFLDDAKALYDAYNMSEVYFIDARDYSDYKEGHIDGALSIPLTEIRRMEGNPPHQINGVIIPDVHRLVVYCKGGDCDESLLVARELRAMNFTCHILLDGYPAWEEAGYPTAEGPDEWLQAFDAEPEG